MEIHSVVNSHHFLDCNGFFRLLQKLFEDFSQVPTQVNPAEDIKPVPYIEKKVIEL